MTQLVRIACVLAAMIFAVAVGLESDATALFGNVSAGSATTAPHLTTKIPAAAYQYQRLIVTNAHTVFGLDAPIATLSAQLDQESGWRWNVSSGVGAQGLAQFMPSTAADLARLYPTELGAADPKDPRWAIMAQQRYMHDLVAAFPGASECDTWAFGLSAYNGGAGWVARDQRVCRLDEDCSPKVWFGQVETHPDTKRAPANIKENRGYPRRILLKLTPVYTDWGRGVLCPGVP